MLAIASIVTHKEKGTGMPSIKDLKPKPEFMFTSNVLSGIIAHNCNCRFCSMNRRNAIKALQWLVGVATTDKNTPTEDDDPMRFEYVPVGAPETPELVRIIVQSSLDALPWPQDERAMIVGWLESVTPKEEAGNG